MNRVEFEHWMTSQAWAILPDSLATLMSWGRSESASAEEAIPIEAAVPRPTPPQRAGAIAVIPLMGPISKRDGMFSRMFGGASIDGFTQQFRQALADESVSSILVQVDSPGGSVQGVEELAAEIYASRSIKPIVAYTDGYAASAAYWIASAAGEFVASPSASVGSIGVFGAHQDVSRMLDAAGVTVTLISAGKYKTEASPFAPLTDEAKSALQAQVDEHYTTFVANVARHRGVAVSAVKAGYGEGRMVSSKQAKAAGMIDSVGTFDSVIKRMSSRSFTANRAVAVMGELVTAAMFNADLSDDAEPVVTGDPVAAVEAPLSQFELERRRRRLRLVGV